VIIIRLGNAFGRGQTAKTGQEFVAAGSARVLSDLEVTQYDQEGTIRDYIQVRELARGITSARERGHPRCCCNMGTGVGKSNLDLLKTVESLATIHGHCIEPRVAEKCGFDVPTTILDNARLREGLGWKPLIPFERRIEQMWNFLASAQ